jgi:membrane protein implicated in regulation of membrane protease activity
VSSVFLLIGLACLVLLCGAVIFDTDDAGLDADWLSVKSFLLFGIGFGSAGAMAASWGLVPAIAAGSIWGVLLAWVGAFISKGLLDAESDSSTPSLVGEVGMVMTPLNPVGEIVVTARGHVHYLRAQEQSGLTVTDRGAAVKVVSFDGTTAMVRTIGMEEIR